MKARARTTSSTSRTTVSASSREPNDRTSSVRSLRERSSYGFNKEALEHQHRAGECRYNERKTRTHVERLAEDKLEDK
jgi:exo-beta-1,3-glucanase (GH17 family)